MMQTEAHMITLPVTDPALSGKSRSYRLLPLLLILSVQAALSLRLIWSNTAFQDEALYLWAGRLEWDHWLHHAPVPDFATYFSGAPVIYPPIGAAANDIGGLAGARVLSLCFMLGATTLLYSVTRRLFDRRAGIAAASVFAFLGVTQNLGAFATYDAMALFLLTLAAWFAVRSDGRRGELALIACALALVLADATKYASLLWNPAILALVTLGAPDTWRKAALRGVRLVIYGTTTALPALFLAGGRSYVTGLMSTTISRQAPGGTPPFHVLEAAFSWVGIVFILALIGFILSFSADDKRVRWLCGILVGVVLLAPLEQARIDTLTSLQKHVTFGAWFAAIAVGYGLSRAADMTGAKIRRLLAVTVIAVLWLGVPQAATLFTWWPNSANMTHELSIALSRSKCPCLLAEDNVASYYLPRQMGAAVPADLYGFSYYDNSTRKELTGFPAYKLAIKDGYFGVIETDAAEDPAADTIIVQALVDARDYTLLATIAASNQKQPFRIWVRN
jgi:4-amino-4-deoxy-L-arabinose transferase-like glycosyltransferase